MSFIGTLAKVAVGVLIARGVGSVIQTSRQGGTARTAGSGAACGGSHRQDAGGAAPGGLQDIMRDVLAGTALATC